LDYCRETGAIIARNPDYSSFYGPFEAQSLGDLLPIIRADRSKLPHPVYGNLNYRMRKGLAIGRAPH
jgi:hypothetical protein